MPACPVAGCERPRRPGHVICGFHWARLPRPLQGAVYRAWRTRLQRPGDPDTIQAHQLAKAEAIEAVVARETAAAKGERA